ncbi:hypothetical protein TNCV_3980491 [Trichonephila clavipes]|nr:hypothetical protein TNCV_3980491 [Trichonephila clavipes]
MRLHFPFLSGAAKLLDPALPLASQKMVSMILLMHYIFEFLDRHSENQDANVRAAVRKWIRRQPESFFIDGMKKWIERLNKCVAVSGDYDEERVYNVYE